MISGDLLFERTRDYDLVRQIMTDPRVWPHISDDLAPAPTDFRPLECEAVWYVLVIGAGEVLGLFAFVPQNSVCWEVHTCLDPRAWGATGARAARELPAWIWANTPCRRIVTSVPAYNRLALRFARAAGMQEFGVNPRSYLKNGELQDQVLLGLSPEEVTCP
jgi:RimJ/RimL family protein N-acetyltransferase